MMLQQIAKYRILEELDTGGQATIYKAEDTRLQGRLVVLKVIEVPAGGPKTTLGKQTLKRFEAEAALTAKLRHPQIVKVNDYGLDKENQVAWMAQDYLDGESLQSLIEKGPVDYERCRGIILSLARVLEYLHKQKIVHRDIKPSNIFLQNDIPMIIDLGLAQDPYHTHRSIPGQKVGTPAYMAPELLDDKKFKEYQYSPSRDWWALGCVAFEIFTGKCLFTEMEPTLLHNQIVSGKALEVAVRELEGHLALPLVKSLLETDPENRASSSDELKRIIQAEKPRSKEEVLNNYGNVVIESKLVSKSEVVIPRLRERRNFSWIWILGLIVVSVFIYLISTVFIKYEIPSGEDYSIDIGNGIQLDMVWIPTGTFLMGSPEPLTDRYDDECPQTEVTLEGFWLGKYEVTQVQYLDIMGANRSYFSGDNNPVETVTWNNAMEFCQKLSEKTGQNYILPTEAQWEYATRAGTATEFSYGNGVNQLVDYVWWIDSQNGTHPVGKKQPNLWGLYDMHGNVAEWCLTLYRDYPYDESDGRNSLYGNGWRVLRGGSFDSGISDYFRCAYRASFYPTFEGNSIGFRVARIP